MFASTLRGTSNVGFRIVVFVNSPVPDVLPRASHKYAAPGGSFVTEQSSVKSAVASYTAVSLHVTTGRGASVCLTVTVTSSVATSSACSEARQRHRVGRTSVSCIYIVQARRTSAFRIFVLRQTSSWQCPAPRPYCTVASRRLVRHRTVQFVKCRPRPRTPASGSLHVTVTASLVPSNMIISESIAGDSEPMRNMVVSPIDSGTYPYRVIYRSVVLVYLRCVACMTSSPLNHATNRRRIMGSDEATTDSPQ